MNILARIRPAARPARPRRHHRLGGAGSAALALLVLAPLLSAGAARAQQVVIRGGPPRAWLGFTYTYGPGTPDRAVKVTDVMDGSPAAHAGLKPQDIIVGINGLAAAPALIASLSRALQPGDTVRLAIRRSGARRTLRVVAEKPPARVFERDRTPWVPGVSIVGPQVVINADSIRRVARIYMDSARRVLDTMHLPHFQIESTDSGMVYRFRTPEGDSVVRVLPRARFDSLFQRRDSALRALRRNIVVRVDSVAGPGQLFRMQIEEGMHTVAGAEFTVVNPDLGQYFDVASGLLVTRVAAGTPAARAGLKPGDVVVRVGGEAVTAVGELRAAVARSRGHTLDLEIVRAKKHRHLGLKLD